jgi:guanine deaminase
MTAGIDYSPKRAFRGMILYAKNTEELTFYPDGALFIDEDGFIAACDTWEKLSNRLQGFPLTELPPGYLILPGFIDLHTHLPQMAVTGCQEQDLLSWLKRHIFMEEARFENHDYAKRISHWFFSELLRNGTTTAAVFLTSHAQACQLAFEAADTLGNRVIMGQNLMDINAPDNLLCATEQALAETEALCQRWHGKDQHRIQYAWMPRFAITSSEALLQGVGILREKYPTVYLHTHLSEQIPEIEAVKQQFPWAGDYTDVYARFGLLGSRTILAHGIHLSDDELSRIQTAQAALAHCPGSNFFLKSGRFRLLEVLRRDILWGLGSDVGAGPELSILKVMRDAQFRQDDVLVPLPALLYGATLGAAKALFLDDRIGSLEPGKEADFIILNPAAKPGFALPDTHQAKSEPESLLSRLIYLGDDRMVTATYIRGRNRYRKHKPW